MIRDKIANNLDHDPDFRWRGEGVTRLENLSDIVFALALGMLVLSGSPPQTMDELKYFLVSIIPVAAGFAILINIWHAHFTFFRRYGMGDKPIIYLNALLLFTVLFVAYPLKFTFESLFAYLLALTGDLSRIERLQLEFGDSGDILTYFGIGYLVIHAIFVLMHRHVLKKRAVLELTTSEIALTKRIIFINMGMVILSALVAIAAHFIGLEGLSGFILFFAFALSPLANRRYPLPAP